MDLLPGVAGVQGPLLLHRQEVDIALPGHVEAVVSSAAQTPALLGKGQLTDWADEFHGVSSRFAYHFYLIIAHFPGIVKRIMELFVHQERPRSFERGRWGSAF